MKTNTQNNIFAEIAERERILPDALFLAVEAAKRTMTPLRKRIAVVEDGSRRLYSVTRQGVGPLRTKYGNFHMFLFKISDDWKIYPVLIKGRIDNEFTPRFINTESLLLRFDSGCETGQTFGDSTCECKEQLMLAMEQIQQHGEGMIIHAPAQDGRGMGLAFKLATLYLQERAGLNTVDAARAIADSETIDVRTYGGVVAVLKFFGIHADCEIRLATNNPKKAQVFAENGYKVADLRPVVVPPTAHTERHLRAKEKYLGHLNLVTGSTERV